MINPVLRELSRGKGAHVDPVACLEDVSADMAGRKIDGYPHSIWQIVGHLNCWMDYELGRIEGELPAYPGHAIETWPESARPKSDDEWKNTVTLFAPSSVGLRRCRILGRRCWTDKSRRRIPRIRRNRHPYMPCYGKP
jgi:hypothetical protein